MPLERRANVRIRALSLAVLLGALLSTVSWAAVDRWMPYPAGVGGPWGGSVRRLASAGPSGEYLWAATGGGVYRSVDGGQTWFPSSDGLENLSVTDIAIWTGGGASAPVDSLRLIAATDGGGVYLSADGGARWARSTGLAAVRVGRVAIDPTDASRCFAATSGEQRDRLYHTTDGGASWSPGEVGSYSRLLFASDGTLYLSPAYSAYYLWAIGPGGVQPGPVGTHLPASGGIADFALPGGTGQVLVVAQQGAGLAVSEDGGASWSERYYSTIPGGNSDYTEVDAVADDPSDPTHRRILFHVYDGAGSSSRNPTTLYESADLGATRQTVSLPERGMDLGGFPGGGLFSSPGADWILENRAGVFRRASHAGAFSHASAGMAAHDSQELAFGPSGKLSVAGGTGIYVWDPLRVEWLRRAPRSGGLGEFPAASTGLVEYRDLDLWLTVTGYGVYRSTDDGGYWDDSGGGIGYTANDRYYGLAFAPGGGLEMLLGTLQGVYRYVFDPGNGSGWTPTFDQNLPWRVAPDRRNPKGFYATPAYGGSQFVVTDDGGLTWTDLTPALFESRASSVLAASERLSGHVVVGTLFGGLWETFDGGVTWGAVGGAALPAGEITALALGGAEDAWVAVFVRGQGVFLSVNGGLDWENVTDGLSLPGDSSGPSFAVNALRFEPGTSRLVVAVQGGGLRYLDLFFSLVLDRGATYNNTGTVSADITVARVETPSEMRFADEAGAWGAWQPFASTASFTFSPGDGRRTVYGQFRSAVGVDLGGGNASIRVDTTPPVVNLTSPASGPTGNTRPLLSYSVDGGPATVSVLVDVAGVASRSGDVLGPFAEGSHTVRVEATDVAQNTGFAEVTFTVDFAMPSVEILSPLPGLTNDRTPTLTYTFSAGTPTVKVDGSVVSKTSGQRLDALADGPHVVRVEAALGSKTGVAQVSLSVDATNPVVSLTSPQAGATTNATPLLVFTVGDYSTFSTTVTVDGVTVGKTSGQQLGPLADGTHVVRVESVDAVGNRGSAQAQFTVSTASSGSGGGGGGGGGCFVGALGGAFSSAPVWAWVVAVLVSLLAGPARAAGPFGGAVQALTLSAGRDEPRWAATWRGLFSYDQSRWHRVEAMGQRDLVRLADCGDRLLASELHVGLFASDDGGATWVQETKGLAGRYGQPVDDILCLRVDPQRPSHLFLGSAGRGPFESQDSGKTWKLLLAGLESEPPPASHAKDLLPAAGDRPLLMGTDGSGLFAWTDGRWVRRGEGLPKNLRVQGLAADPTDPKHLALASRGEGLWESRDGGRAWKLLRKGAYGVVGVVSIGSGGEVAAHFLGEGLAVVRKGQPEVVRSFAEMPILALEPRRKAGWLAGLANDGVMVIGADGKPGGWVNSGLDATRILSVAAGPAAGEIWCGDSNGVFHSADSGATWEPRDLGLLPAAANVLLWHAGQLYVGTNGQGVFRWVPDKGAWEERTGGMGTSNTIFALVQDAGGKRLYAGTEGGVLRTDDGGGLWSQKNQGLPLASQWVVAASPTRPGEVWAAGAGGLFRSEDGAETWTAMTESKAVSLVAEAREGEVRLWVLEAGRLAFASGRETTSSPLPLAPDERLMTVTVGGGSVWIGSTKGLWRLGAGAPEKVLEGPGILSVVPTGADLVLVGTEGRGLLRVRLDKGAGGG